MNPIFRNTLKVVAALSVLVVLFLPQTVEAQRLWQRYKTKKGMPNLPKYDRNRFHFGFTLGMNSTDFVVKQRDDLYTLDSVYVVESIPQVGFNLGIVSNMRLGQYFDVRFIPGISFVGRQMEYQLIRNDTVPSIVTKPTESVFFDFPLYFKFKSKRLMNFRAYVLAGGKFSIDMSSKEKVDNEEELLKLAKYDYTYDMGVGIDLYLEFFKLSIEAKMAFGLNNFLIKDGTLYTESLNSLKSKTFLVSFYFE